MMPQQSSTDKNVNELELIYNGCDVRNWSDL